MSKKDFTINERLASLEATFTSTTKYQNDKLESIHKILVGNGQPGLVSEVNENKNEISRWKGVIKGIAIVTSILFSIFTLVLAFVK